MSVTRGGCVCGHRAHEPGMCVPPVGRLGLVDRCTCTAGVSMSQEATWVVRERSAARYQKQLAGTCSCDHDLHNVGACPVWDCYCALHWGLPTEVRETVEVASLWAPVLVGAVVGIVSGGIVALIIMGAR